MSLSDTNIPSFSTGVGLAIRGYEQKDMEAPSTTGTHIVKERRKHIDGFLNRIKNWFEQEDQDY